MRIETLIIAVIILLSPATIMLLATNDHLFDEEYYHAQFVKHGTYGRVAEADKTLSGLLEYFRSSGTDEPDIEGFNSREKSHLLDVRLLVRKGAALLLMLLAAQVLLILQLISMSKDIFKHLGIVFCASGASTILAMGTLLVGAFSERFTQFHSLFFPAGTWLFSSDDLLIRMFPFEFFYETSARIVMSSITFSVILILVGICFFIEHFHSKKGTNR